MKKKNRSIYPIRRIPFAVIEVFVVVVIPEADFLLGLALLVLSITAIILYLNKAEILHGGFGLPILIRG